MFKNIFVACRQWYIFSLIPSWIKREYFDKQFWYPTFLRLVFVIRAKVFRLVFFAYERAFIKVQFSRWQVRQLEMLSANYPLNYCEVSGNTRSCVLVNKLFRFINLIRFTCFREPSSNITVFCLLLWSEDFVAYVHCNNPLTVLQFIQELCRI